MRIEDRLHANIIQPTDECWFTVRPTSYTLEVDDLDIVPGSDTVAGNGVREEGTISGTGEDTVFLFAVQAAALNLDPELDYWYDVTYVRDGYSVSVASGEFDLGANVTSRGAQVSYVGTGSVFQLVAGMDGQNLLNVQASMPMPRTGDPGTGSYVIAQTLSETVGNTVSIPLTSIAAPAGRQVQVGDVIFSSLTSGVLATIQAIDLTGTPSATVVTRQVYGRHALKALLDVTLKIVPLEGATIESIDYAWSVPKTDVPLPAGYEYRVGDMVFSHSAVSGYAVTKKMLISLVESVTATHLNVRTKVVFPMFLDTQDIEDLLAGTVPETRTVNSKALTSNISLTEDDIPAGAINVKFTSAEKTKLTDLPTNAALTTSLAGKAATSHTHEISGVNGLQTALNGKVGSATIVTIWSGTQAAYDAITPKLDNTLYFIKG